MISENNMDLAKYRLEKSAEMLNDAQVLFEKGGYKSSNNRAYYAIFHAMRAVLALEKIDFKKHSGVIQHFQKEYVKTGKFDLECSNIIMHASKIRNVSDYDDFFIATREEAEKQIVNAKYFYECVNKYLSDNVR